MEYLINTANKTIKVEGSLTKQDLERLIELLSQLEGYSVVTEQQIINVPSQWIQCPCQREVPYWEYHPTTVDTCSSDKFSNKANDYNTIQVTYSSRSEQ